jgi:hypothetical protein
MFPYVFQLLTQIMGPAFFVVICAQAKPPWFKNPVSFNTFLDRAIVQQLSGCIIWSLPFFGFTYSPTAPELPITSRYQCIAS